jgi:uncharacterized protein YegL
VVLLLGASDSLTSQDWTDALSFASFSINVFANNFANPRFSVVTFSETVHIDVPFGFSDSLVVIQNQIASLVQMGQSIYLANALDTIRTSVLEDVQGRSSIVIYVTNAASQDDTVTLNRAVQSLRNTGTDIWVLAVGDQVSEPEISLLSSAAEYVDAFSTIAPIRFADRFILQQCAA